MSIRTIRSNAPTAVLPASEHGVRKVMARGAIAGSFGAGTLALWFLVVDALMRTPMWSPSLMGDIVLKGAQPAAGASVDLGLVAGFSLVHFALFTAFGIAVTWALRLIRTRPFSLLGVAFIAVALHGSFVVADLVLFPGLGDALGWIFVGAGNVAAAVSMALCLAALPSADAEADSAPEEY